MFIAKLFHKFTKCVEESCSFEEITSQTLISNHYTLLLTMTGPIRKSQLIDNVHVFDPSRSNSCNHISLFAPRDCAPYLTRVSIAMCVCFTYIITLTYRLLHGYHTTRVYLRLPPRGAPVAHN
jgi:hypothetical protein